MTGSLDGTRDRGSPSPTPLLSGTKNLNLHRFLDIRRKVPRFRTTGRNSKSTRDHFHQHGLVLFLFVSPSLSLCVCSRLSSPTPPPSLPPLLPFACLFLGVSRCRSLPLSLPLLRVLGLRTHPLILCVTLFSPVGRTEGARPNQV